jgi:hypothetical protein
MPAFEHFVICASTFLCGANVILLRERRRRKKPPDGKLRHVVRIR